MKVKYMQTQLMNDEIVYRLEGEVPNEFENIDEATRWIDQWLDDKENLIWHYGFEHERKGNVLRWSAMGITFVEVLDVTV